MAISNIAGTTLENLKKYLKISLTDTSKDDLLELLIESTTQAVEDFLGRYIVSRTISQEPYDCENSKSKYLQLKQYPISTITSIMQDGNTLPLNTLKIDLHNGIIKKNIFWTGAVLVSYTAGIAQNTASVPKNLQLAIWIWIQNLLAKQESGIVKSESLGDYSVNYQDESSIPSSVRSLLEGYRRFDL